MVLPQLIKQTPLPFDLLLESSLQPALDASATIRQQNLLVAALRSDRPPRKDKSRSPVRIGAHLLRISLRGFPSSLLVWNQWEFPRLKRKPNR